MAAVAEHELGSITALSQRLRALPGWCWTLAMLAGVAGVALATRVLLIASAPPGLRYAEAGSALYAQTIGADARPIFFIGPNDAREPLFYYVAQLTGELFGWGVAGPRLAAALLGTLAAVGCALWLARALGRSWGLLAGLLAAGSFWQLIYSRQAVQPIAAAACAAFGLWALQRALDEEGNADSPRYMAAGALFGLGFYADLSFRVILPALVIISAYLWLVRRLDLRRMRQRRIPTQPAFARRDEALPRPVLPPPVTPRRDVSVRGLGLMLLTTTLVMTPLASYYITHPESFELGFTLADGWPNDPFVAGWDYLLTFWMLLWHGPSDWAVNLPGRPLLDPVLACWTVAGVLVALRHPLRPLHGLALLWLLLFALPAALLNPADPGLLLAAMPAVFVLPVIALHATWQLAARALWRFLRPIAALAIVGSVAVSMAWSLYDYFWQWSEAPETYAAFQGDVRDSLEAIERLPHDDELPIYYSAHELDRILRYLAPNQARRDFTDPATLPVPATGRAYLVYPRSTEPDPQLLAFLDPAELVETGYGPDGTPVYQVWLLDLRIRDRLPRSAPTVFFPNGYELQGYQVTPAADRPPEERMVDVILKWRVPAGANWATAQLRFDVSGDRAELVETRGQILIQPWSDPPQPMTELIVTHIRMPFPQIEPPIADLLAGLLDPYGRPLEPFGDGVLVVEQHEAVMTRIAFLP